MVRCLHVRAGHLGWGQETTRTTAAERPDDLPGPSSPAARTVASQRGLAHLAMCLYTLREASGALGEPSEGPETSGPGTAPRTTPGQHRWAGVGLGSPQLAGEQAGLPVSRLLVEDTRCLGETKDSLSLMARVVAFCAGP